LNSLLGTLFGKLPHPTALGLTVSLVECGAFTGRFRPCPPSEPATQEVPNRRPYADQLNLAIGAFSGDGIELFDHTLGTYITSFCMVGLGALVSCFAMQRIVHLPFGHVMVAIRDTGE